MTLCTDIHGLERVHSNDFGDPLTFALAAPAGQSFHLDGEISLHLLDQAGLIHCL